MRTVVVAGALANKPLNGGEAWVRLSWVRGLRRVGFDVHFVEELSRSACVDRRGNAVAPERSVNLAYFRDVVRRFGLEHRSTLLDEDGDALHGLPPAELAELASRSELLVNVSGHLRRPDLLERFPRKAYVDLDPGFTQFWHEDGADLRLADHHFHLTVGENVGSAYCPIPTGGFDWRPVRQPVLLDDWAPGPPPAVVRFTTVASWRGAFGAIEREGRRYGLKVHEFRKFIPLPRAVQRDFEIALAIHPADHEDRDALLRNGWSLVDPSVTVPDPVGFRDYVASSGAEFSVAQGIYVDTVSGWFSDRSVRYLATGRPVLLQDTGFTRNYPVGEGLLAFRTLEEAAEGVERISRDYRRHSAAARRLAEEYFDAERVLPELVREMGVRT